MGVYYPKGWRFTLPLAKPGSNLANLFALYRSQGDVTISSATSLPTTLDGPIQVVRYGSLTVNSVLSASNRCRGLIVLCESLAIGASCGIHMDGLGAVGSATWIPQNITIPSFAVISGKVTPAQKFLAWIRDTGFAIFDPTLFALSPPSMGDIQTDYADWPARGTAIMTATGRGSRGARYSQLSGQSNGNPGGAGTNAPAGGGCGGMYLSSNGYASPGQMWGGGTGSDAAEGGGYYQDADQYSARYGGAPLIVICRGNVSIASGGYIRSAAVQYLASSGQGQAGGGFAGLFYGGTLSNAGSISAPGALGSGSPVGGNGGAGAAVTKTLSQMGWA